MHLDILSYPVLVQYSTEVPFYLLYCLQTIIHSLHQPESPLSCHDHYVPMIESLHWVWFF